MSATAKTPPTPADHVPELIIRLALMDIRQAVDQLIVAADRIETRYPTLASRLRDLSAEVAGRTLDHLRGTGPRER